MKYMIFTLPTSSSSAEELINIYAKEGWEVICPLAEYRLILGKETTNINVKVNEDKE